jgi:hypothetical protein
MVHWRNGSVISHDLLLSFFLGRGGQGDRGASSMSCSSLHYHVRLQLCRLFFLYCRYESVMNLFVVIVHFRASRAILSSVDLVLGLCLFVV